VAKARAIVKRRKAVQNIRKITHTMQLIATARYQKAYKHAVATKPYTRKITELVQQVSSAARDVAHPLLKVNTESERAVLLVLTSNRGLCGGYNAGVLRVAIEELRTLDGRGLDCDLHVSGKKGIGYFRFLRRDMAARYTEFDGMPRFEAVERLADEFMDAYSAGRLDRVGIAYTRFVSTGLQTPTVLQLLPLQRPGEEEVGGETRPPGGDVQYDFSPPPDELLAELLPMTLKVRLFQCFTDAAVSEQVARMVAMKAATDSATDMIKTLTTQYNRARQTQITLELLDIVGGAEALK
jgi:F-type H+-transporting ATPase subunit gamma